MLKVYSAAGCHLNSIDPITAPAKVPDAIWLDLCAAAPEEFAFATRETGLSLPEESDIVEIETSSRLSVNADVLTVTMPIVSRGPEGLQASACGFVLSPTRLVTIRLVPSILFDHFAEQIHNLGAVPSASLFCCLLEAITYRHADELERLRRELDELSHTIFHHRRNGADKSGKARMRDVEKILQNTLITLGRDYDTITFLRDSQLGIGRIATFVRGNGTWLPADVLARLRALEADVSSLNEFSTHLTDKVQFLQDATLGLINIAQNALIKVLTIVSIVGIPPTLIAGIYGMNFVNIPELHWDFGYAYAWVLMILSAVLPLFWFRKKGWV